MNDFQNHARERGAKITLLPAYDADNLMLGISRIKSAIDKEDLVIPADSIAYNQLRDLNQDDLDNEEALFAINALRHVIGSYYRVPPVIQNQHTSRLQKRLRAGRPNCDEIYIEQLKTISEKGRLVIHPAAVSDSLKAMTTTDAEKPLEDIPYWRRP